MSAGAATFSARRGALAAAARWRLPFSRQAWRGLAGNRLGAGSGSHAQQTANVMVEIEPVLLREQPDVVLVAGDVNSTVAVALTAAKLGFAVAHVEAGQRSRVARAEGDGLRRQRTHSACSVISFASASIAARRAVLLRHTAPICRCGAGLANGRSTTPRALR